MEKVFYFTDRAQSQMTCPKCGGLLFEPFPHSGTGNDDVGDDDDDDDDDDDSLTVWQLQPERHEVI